MVFNEIQERKILLNRLYKIYYDDNSYLINNNPLVDLRDKLIDIKYTSIPEIIYKNKKFVIKHFSNCSLKQKIIHHLTYFYLSDIDLNYKEVIEIAKGDLEFIRESFKFLKAFNNVSIIEYRIIYEIVENISKILEIELVV